MNNLDKYLERNNNYELNTVLKENKYLVKIKSNESLKEYVRHWDFLPPLEKKIIYHLDNNISTLMKDKAKQKKLQELIKDRFYLNPTWWDVTEITDMSYLFYKYDSPIDAIGNWNIINVKSMKSMFEGCMDSIHDKGDPINWIQRWGEKIGECENLDRMFAFSSINYDSFNTWDVTNKSYNDMFSGSHKSSILFYYSKIEIINKWMVNNFIKINDQNKKEIKKSILLKQFVYL